ncbi:MAG: hypothetical protein IJ923_04475 [Campylobacter sp.]|nr:hypothetical protein [Campylobacter sp.]
MENSPSYIKFAEYIESIRDSDDEKLKESDFALIEISHYFEQGARFLYVLENLDRLEFALDLVKDEPLWEWFADYGISDEKSLKSEYDKMSEKLEKINEIFYYAKKIAKPVQKIKKLDC